jgi:diguanylate cyclase (GGDEF)-like protein
MLKNGADAQTSSVVAHWSVLLGGPTPQRRFRVRHWLIATVVYFGIGILLLVGVHQEWMRAAPLAAWTSFVAVVITSGFIALRSGWSERFADPSLTMWQLSMGVIAVNWGYVICGPMRTSALFPLMVIFAFGAFSLRYRQIAVLTVFAICCLAAAIIIRENLPATSTSGGVTPLQVDLNNLFMILVVLPALALVAAGLSTLRRKLGEQRAALAQALSEVERLAVSDVLTGLPNRRAMLEALARSATHSRRGIMPFCVAMLDLDHFKHINDTLGHATGDIVLKRFADTMTLTLREGDVFGRWGGEEFLLLLPGATLQTAQMVLARMQVKARDIILPNLQVTFSAGIATDNRGEPTDALLARADAALYRAKNSGRNRIASADDATSP